MSIIKVNCYTRLLTSLLWWLLDLNATFSCTTDTLTMYSNQYLLLVFLTISTCVSIVYRLKMVCRVIEGKCNFTFFYAYFFLLHERKTFNLCCMMPMMMILHLVGNASLNIWFFFSLCIYICGYIGKQASWMILSDVVGDTIHVNLFS